jgi:hypothetical protein
MVTMFDDLASIGMELLHAPLIGAEKFAENIPWAKDEVSFEERHKRYCDFIHPPRSMRRWKPLGNRCLPISLLQPRKTGRSPSNGNGTTIRTVGGR